MTVGSAGGGSAGPGSGWFEDIEDRRSLLLSPVSCKLLEESNDERIQRPRPGHLRGHTADGRRCPEHRLRNRRDRKLELLRPRHALRVRQPQNVGLGHADPRNRRAAVSGHVRLLGHLCGATLAQTERWSGTRNVRRTVELLAAFSLFSGNPFGRYFGIAVGALAALGALFELPAYPLWSLAVFALSLWIIHGLAIYGGPEDMPNADASAGPTMRQQGPRPPM